MNISGFYGLISGLIGIVCLILGTGFGYFLHKTQKEPVPPALWSQDTEKLPTP